MLMDILVQFLALPQNFGFILGKSLNRAAPLESTECLFVFMHIMQKIEQQILSKLPKINSPLG